MILLARLALPILLGLPGAFSQINVADVPACARSCLYNIANIVTDQCGTINVQCLCNSPIFVSAFSCCLATNCTTADQAITIRFNQEQCATVNATAPAFVGCSPDGLSTVNNTRTTAVLETTVQQSSFTSSDTRQTVSELFTQVPKITATGITTVDFDGRPMLTSSCTVPYFALTTAAAGDAILYPQVGCGANRPGCCPYDPATNAVLDKCPQDYFSTAAGCCPFGYSVYETRLGTETPCYSIPSVSLVPAVTPTATSLTIITNYVFTRKLALEHRKGRRVLSDRAITGIVVGVVVLLVSVILAIWKVRQHKARVGIKSGTATFPLTDPVLPTSHDSGIRQELENLERLEMATTDFETSSAMQKPWSLRPSSPPAYEKEKAASTSQAQSEAHELPGSVHMHEHHPAFSRPAPGVATTTRASPVTPTRSATGISLPDSLATSSAVSPALSAATEDQRSNSPRIVVSPLSSPGLRQRRRDDGD